MHWKTLEGMARNRKVPALKVGKRWRFRLSSLNTWLENELNSTTTNTRKSMFLSIEKFPTQVAVERHLEAFVLKLNSENQTLAILEPTFAANLRLFLRFGEERM